MDISVLIPVCNKENVEYFKMALDSIINQTYQAKEIVIVKDGILSDDINKTINSYITEFPNFIHSYQLNKCRCLGEVLRYGVEKCKYDYIARMDADDVSITTRFELQVDELIKNKDIDIIGGYIEEYDEKMENLIDVRKVPLISKNIIKFAKRQCPFNHGSVIIKKSTLLKIGNYSNYLLEDYELWARMIINKCNMKNIPYILVKNRTGNEMYKRRSGLKQVKKIFQIERVLLNYKIINLIEFFCNIIIRILVAFCPVKLKKFLYKYIIRKFIC